ncbi:MAG TPA: hypothetical protein VNT81_11640 [Vicinamibacterales bacterium]|nr:hypothetical protein [Vicinamibacterales bacterium]
MQQLKLRLHDKAPKTVNKVLATSSVLQKTAVEWQLIKRLPCAIRLLPVEPQDAGSTTSMHTRSCSKQRVQSTGELTQQRTWRYSDNPKCLAANARPDPDFKYVSKRSANFADAKSSDTTTDHGRCRFVQPVGPWLCHRSLAGRSRVTPT